MSAPRSETGGVPEPIRRGEGVQIKFVNPDLLREYIVNPDKPGRVSFAERQAGLREISLGEFRLDGELFETVAFSLLIESSQDPKRPTPTTIIRSDLSLGSGGDESSDLHALQVGKSTHEDTTEEEINYLSKLGELFGDSSTEGLGLFQLGRNTLGVSPDPAPADRDYECTLFQVWEKDVGFGTVSISLFSFGRYYHAWRTNYDVYLNAESKGWETDEDDIDGWNFITPVGIPTHDAQRFTEALDLYGQAFSAVLGAIYKAEGRPIPHTNFEIESPTILRDDEKVTFRDVGGQQEAVEFLQAVVDSEKEGRMLTKRPLILLVGPPGNGKSTLAQATANELGAPLVVATTRSLPAEAKGTDYFNLLESGHLSAKAAARMRGGKAVYCVEGVEAMLEDDRRLQDRFLSTMDVWANDQVNDVLFIATTNFPERLHPGIRSRFNIVEVSTPNKKGVGEIILILVDKLARQAGRNDVFGPVDLEKVIGRLEGSSGRDILNALSIAYYKRRRESQEAGNWLPIDTDFLLTLFPEKPRLGFQTT